MMPPFRIACVAALALFVVIGLTRHHGDPQPDPAGALVDHFRAAGYKVSPPKNVFWGAPAVSVSVPSCPDPVEAVGFVFDDITISGVLEGVLAANPGVLQVSYAGQTFPDVDRAALFRLRVDNAVAEFLRTGRVVDPPVFFLFWPKACTPKAIS